MGNSEGRPKFEHGDIYLQLDQPYVMSGATLTGNVHINLSQPYPARSLEIGIKGKEKVKWVRRRRNGKNRSAQRISKSDILIFQIFEIYRFDNGVALPGQYTIPFNLIIPGGLPSSVFYSGRSNSKAVIDYSIKAMIRQPESTRAKEMSFKSSIIVKEIPYAHENISQSIEANIMSNCGCTNNGPVKCRFRFPKNSYAINEVVTVQCSIDNSQCNMPIQNIRIKIKQYVNLRSDWHTLNRSYTKAERLYDGISANESTGEYARELNLNLSTIPGTMNDGVFHGMFTDLDEERKLTKYLQPSTSGKYITISYILSVKLIYNISCGEQPGCEIPLHIHAAELPPSNIIQAPDGWNPVILGGDQHGVPIEAPVPEMLPEANPEVQMELPLPMADLPEHPAAPPQKIIENECEEPLLKKDELS
ncbi:unnamed protein product [Moneuplotes crassus]|uniref:Arrestin C-terminal-like domain-containing protein n=1 Tax=Euplotes crassus TaxID=5936 RepID=A0AAD1XCI5_EUPCR|nr:unnamed protein product [Moneuplotes crassus]